MQVTIENSIFDVEYEHLLEGIQNYFNLTSIKLNGVELIGAFDAVDGLVKFEQLAYEQFKKGQQ
ncbi:MAG: hypothetical protein V4493_01130 [Pseudomonadota bacterium]